MTKDFCSRTRTRTNITVLSHSEITSIATEAGTTTPSQATVTVYTPVGLPNYTARRLRQLVGTHRVRTHAVLLLTLTLTFDLSTQNPVTCRISQGHSLYFEHCDHSFLIMLRTDRQTNRRTRKSYPRESDVYSSASITLSWSPRRHGLARSATQKSDLVVDLAATCRGPDANLSFL